MDLADAWSELLKKKPRLDYVKGYEAFRLSGQFTGWNEQERDKRLLEFVDVIDKHSGKGIAFAIDHKPFTLIKKLKDDTGHYFKDPNNLAYVMALSSLLQALPLFRETVADIVFDYDLISRREATAAYKKIFDEWPREITKRLLRKEPHWEDDKNFLPLQAADLLAYCVRANRDPGERGDRVRRSPVLSALGAIDTGIGLIEEKQLSVFP